MRIAGTALLVAAIGLAGCHKAPITHVKDVGVASLGAMKVAESLDHKVTIGVAQGWGKGMSTQTNPQDFVASMGGELPPGAQQKIDQANEKDYAEDIAQAEKTDGIIISVVDQGTRPVVGEQRTRYTVKRIRETPGITLDEAAAAAKDDIMREGAPQKVELPIGPAIRYDSSVDQRDGGVVTRIMYVIVDGADLYEVTFTTESAPQVISSIAPQIINTLRIKPSTDS